MAEAGAKLTINRAVAAIAAIAGCAAIAQAALGEEPRALAVDLGDCVELQSAEERFECYERRVEAARRAAEGEADASGSGAETEAAATPARAAPSDVDRAPAAPAEAEPQPAQEVLRAAEPNADTFGLTERQERRADERTEMRGVVASLRQTVPNSYLIELENGQIWRQMRPQRYHLRPGHHVTIYSTNWGSSFRLSADELNGFIQVERVR